MNLQFDLGVAHMKVGDKRRAEGNLDAALDNYQTARGVFQQLVEADPRSTDVRFNVGLSCFKIGDTFRDQGNPAAALDSYQAASKAFQQLVGSTRASSDGRIILRVYRILSARSSPARAIRRCAGKLQGIPGDQG